MLTASQAQEIVQGSIKNVVGNAAVTAATKLVDAGFGDQNSLIALVKTIAGDPLIGVPRFQHFIDPNDVIGTLNSAVSVQQLTEIILKLSAGKMCSNPHTPHPQKCCPYPAKCPQCGYPV